MPTMRSHDDVAREHAEANPTDPYAYRRMLLHLDKGYEDADAVLADALRAINQRRTRHS